MLKKIFLILLLFPVTFNLNAAPSFLKNDTLLKIVQQKDESFLVPQLMDFLETHLKSVPLDSLEDAKASINDFLYKNNVEGRIAFNYFVESVCQDRLSHKKESEDALIKSIKYAEKNQDHPLLYVLLNYLAYRQTEEGNPTAAISSYRLAKKQAAILNDIYMQLIININISDVYYKNNYYAQSLIYLNQAGTIISKYQEKTPRIKLHAPRLEAVIDYNKSEIFFRLNMPDSLKVYNKKLLEAKVRYYKLFTFQNRTNYYYYLLRHEYAKAINLINLLQHNKAYLFDNRDNINLADAYFKSGQTGPATLLINQLLTDSTEKNHPEVKYHLYDILGQIAENKMDYKGASSNFKLALAEATNFNSRLTQVGNISSLIQIDDIESAYNQQNEIYERERIWLLFTVFVSLLTIVIIVIIYWNIKQKRHYERLLFTTKKEELAFINSHEVRKHLTNILGLVEVIRNSDNKENEFLQSEDHLFYSAEHLDKAIKNISEKLDD